VRFINLLSCLFPFHALSGFFENELRPIKVVGDQYIFLRSLLLEGKDC